VCPGQLRPEFQQVCEIQGDLSSIADTLSIRYGPCGQYVLAKYKVRVSFDGIQLQAYVEWNDTVSFTIRMSEYDSKPILRLQSLVCRGPLSLIPNAVE
jgi:hypothetical protein